jgi:DNA-binding NarL/FixJ family response regulator
MSKKITFVLVDDEILIRKGIKAILEQEDIFEVIFEAANGLELLEFLNTNSNIPDIVLTDIRMPGLNGVEATKIITSQFPNIKIIALSSYDSPIFVKNILDVGAVGHISKSVPPEELLQKIKLIVENGFYFKESMLKTIKNEVKNNKTFFDTDLFTSRELDVLKLICKQLSATEIAEKLCISSRTVDGHRNNLLLKTESKNITGLVVFAIKNDYYNPNSDFLD